MAWRVQAVGNVELCVGVGSFDCVRLRRTALRMTIKGDFPRRFLWSQNVGGSD